MTVNTTASFVIEPFNDLQDQFYGIIHALPSSSTFYTGSISTAEFDNYRDGLFLRTVNDYFQSDQVKVTFLPTDSEFPARPNGVIDHSFNESSLLGLSALHGYTVNGDSVAFSDQIQGVDQSDYVNGVQFPGMVRYFKQNSLVLSGVLDASAVYPFFVDSANKPDFNGFMIEPFPLYTGIVRFVENPLASQFGLRSNGFLGADNAEHANPLGSALIGFGNQRSRESLSEYQYTAPRAFVDSGADLILVESNGMFVGATSQRDNDVLSVVSCSHLTPWRDEYSGRSFVELAGGSSANSALELLAKTLPLSDNPDVSLPYYAHPGYSFGDSVDFEQTRDNISFVNGWTPDLSYNQASIYGTDSVAYSGYMR